MATCLAMALLALSGCALVPPGKGTLEGTYTASLGLNFGTAVTLNLDGTYQRQVSFTYCVPLVIVTEQGKEPVLQGWVNRETGTWTMAGRIVLLKPSRREIGNSAVVKEYFDDVRSYPVTYRRPQGWTLVYPNKYRVPMRRETDWRVLAPEATTTAEAPTEAAQAGEGPAGPGGR